MSEQIESVGLTADELAEICQRCRKMWIDLTPYYRVDVPRLLAEIERLKDANELLTNQLSNERGHREADNKEAREEINDLRAMLE